MTSWLAAALLAAFGPLTQAQSAQADKAIQAVKALCLVGTQLDLRTDTAGNLTLEKLVPGTKQSVSVNVRQSAGAADIFDEKIRQVADQNIRDCMKPYIGRIVDAILGEHSAATRPLMKSAERPLPRAVLGKFNIALVHLDGDTEDHQTERSIWAALARASTANIEPMTLDRRIAPSRDSADQHRLDGDKQARELLAKTGADVLIWGEVLKGGIPQLYWTLSEGKAQKGAPEAYRLVDDIVLPPLFWTDLTDVLELVIASTKANLMKRIESRPAGELDPFIGKVRTLVQSSNAAQWNRESRVRVLVILATALTTSAEQSGRRDDLSEAIDLFNEALRGFRIDSAPLEWAAICNDLGVALWILGARTNDSSMLLTSEFAFRMALQQRARDRDALEWAATQNNLGNVLAAQGAKTNDATTLQLAMDAYYLSLEERKPDKVPLDWATTQTSMGLVLVNLGVSTSDRKYLQRAVEAFHAAGRVFTHAASPMDWAKTENNLGIALGALGQADSGTDDLHSATDAFGRALSEITRQKVPYFWAAVNTNLGITLQLLGEIDRNAVELTQAAAAYQRAITGYEDAKDWPDVQLATQHLQNVQGELNQSGVGS